MAISGAAEGPSELKTCATSVSHTIRCFSRFSLIHTACLLALLLLPAPHAVAQEADTTVFRVGEIVVQAARPVTTTGGAAALEITIDSVRLAAPSLEQLMRTLPLVQIRTNSRGEAQFSLRGSGSDARQVAVLVDGIPLSLGWDDRADLSLIPTTAAQTITLSRGLPSLLYGPNVLGGVIEIGVARGAGAALNPRSLRLDAAIDHTGAYATSAALTLPRSMQGSRLLVRAGGGYHARDGFALPRGVREPVPGSNADLRVNTDLRHADAFAALRYEASAGFWTAATLSGFTARRGIPAELHTSAARYWRYPATRRGLAVLAGGTGERSSPFGGVGDLELSIGLDAARGEIDQFTGREYTTVASEEDGTDRNVTLRLRGDQTIGRRAELRGAFTYADINHDEQLVPGGSATYRQRLWSAATEVSLRTHLERAQPGTRISAGLAWDGADTPASGDKPPLAALDAWGARAGFTSLLAGTRLLVHGGVSRRVRFPALRELYSGALGRFEPNPDLAPEKLIAAEAGGTMRAGRGEVQLVVFHHALSDAIVRVATAEQRFKRVNRDRQRASGLELLARGALGGVDLGAELALQHTALYDDRGVEHVSEYQPNITAGVTAAATLPLDARLDLRLKHVGRQHCVNAAMESVAAIASSRKWDAELAKSGRMRTAWTATFEASLAIDNVADTAIYDQCGLPQPGRTLRAQLRLR